MYTECAGVSCGFISLTVNFVINFAVTHDTFQLFCKTFADCQPASLLINSTENATILKTAIKLINQALLVISHQYKLKAHTDEATQKQNVHVIITH